jgi:hypothetical protein
MLDLKDAIDAVVTHLEANILGIGIKAAGTAESDLGKKIFSAGFYSDLEKTGRISPAPPDPLWVVAHVPSLAFWQIGFAPVLDYPIKRKIVTKDEKMLTVSTKEEFYRAKILMQAELYARTNFERAMMLAQISTLFNTVSRGTGRITTGKGNFIYLKMIEARQPQEPELAVQHVYRLIMTWELRVRDLVETVEPMFKNSKYILRYNGNQVVVPKA